ncbi:MAG TPA: tetratricopeptide repeat protein [Chitinophagaceae bacterium]|nr:tetratricopeptide repeat protein [Chitinophagaceae bacterium]
MKNQSLVLLACLFCISAVAQQTRFYSDPDERFKEAKEYFQKEQYSLAYPLFKELQQGIRETDRANNPVISQEVDYYTTVCALKQNEGRAEEMARQFIDLEKNTPRTQQMSFHLAEFYYRKKDFGSAIQLYEQAGISNLSNREIADMKFHQGYCYFTLQRFNQAKPLFNTIRQIRDDPNYVDANYYYGFLAFRDRDYASALQSFQVVENEPAYSGIVPYYIAQIYYIQGKKQQALSYAEQKVKSGKAQFYDVEMKQLLGHAYFERKEYDKALPYLEAYVNKSDKVRREDLYELSYCYYQAGQLTRAIEGFKQLSGKEDTLSQHAMYLLGDAYLRVGQKANARNAFLFCASNSSNAFLREVSRYNYAKLSYELGYQDEALNSLRSFLASYPGSAYADEARDLLVAVLANTNNYKDALALLDGMQSPTPNARRLYPRILYGRATELINDGRLQDAEALLDKALKDPNNGLVLPYINFWKGELAYRANRLDDAIRFYNAYLAGGAPSSGEANSLDVRYNLGYCYFRKENYPVALTFFEQVVRTPALNTEPLLQDAYLRSADCYFMNRDYARARSMYENVIRLSWPAEDYATFQNAMISGIRSPRDKITLLTTMTRKFPSSSLVDDANMEIANAYLADEHFAEAIPYLNNVIRTTENTNLRPRAYLKLGIVYYNLNNNDQALQAYKTLVSQFPNSPEADDALSSIKNIYLEEAKTSEYADYMRQAGRPLSVDSEDSLTYAAAENQYESGNTSAALTAFGDYLKRFPNGANTLDANFYMAEIYNSRKDWNNALTGYEAVASRAPNVYAERAVLAAARISFFEAKDYAKAEGYFTQLKQITASQENRLEAMRGLLRCQYQLQEWEKAVANAKDLLNEKGSSTDDKSLANMAIAKSYQVGAQYDLAIANFKTVVMLNKAALAAEARYEIAHCWFAIDKLNEAEKAAFEVINKSGSYDFWVTKAYLLLGDIYFKEKDYFNAKATFQSIVDNSINTDLKTEAQTKLSQVIAEESKSSKVGG